MKEQIYILTKGKKVLFEGTKQNCFNKLLDIQPNSCYYAIHTDNYKITVKTKKL